MNLFSTAVNQIEEAYTRVGHSCGWRFLYCPKRTLFNDSPILFAGLNPAGSKYYSPMPSVEEGNAYRVEKWGEDNSPSLLQRQVIALFEILAHKVGQSDVAAFMDATLTTNFCPFRSPCWRKLPNRRESVIFSRSLWLQLMVHISPSVIICFTDVPYRYLRKILIGWGAEERFVVKEKVEWGKATYTRCHLVLGGREILMLRLPHLSRFCIIGRPESMGVVEQFTNVAAEYIYGRA